MIRKYETRFIGLLAAFCAVQAPAADSLVLNQALLGNIFVLNSDTVQIPVQTTGDQVRWTATDFFGVVTNGPVVAVNGSGQATIMPMTGRLGYFDLRVTALRDGNPVATADTTFAVLAPSNVSAMQDSAFGVMTHFAQEWSNEIMPLLARAGVVHFRDEQYWQIVEPTRTNPGTYTFTRYEPYMAAAASLGLKPHLVLSFANSNYDSGFSPYTNDGRTGYANYSKALLNRYGSQIDTVAIWNEYNGSFSTGPATADRALYYTQMLQTAYSAIKASRPEVRVVGGASVPVPVPWFENLFALGALDSLDVLDVHPYRSIPEGVEIDLEAVRTLMASYNRGNGPKPMWATECGAPDPVNQGRQNMARYLVRLMTLMRTAGVERAYWYLFYDYDGYSTGLVRAPGDPLGRYVPSSAFPAYSTLIRQLYGASYAGRDPTDARTRCYRFSRGGTDLRVAWSTDGTSQLLLTTNTALTKIDIMGESTVIQPTNGMIALTVDATPFYLLGPISAVREIGRDVIVAESFRDFSSSRGTSNGAWDYGNNIVPAASAYDPAAFLPMTYAKTAFEFAYMSVYAYAKIDANGAHPSALLNYPVEHPIWSVRRWYSNRAAKARIYGTIVRADGHSAASSDGTGAKIYVDGNLVYSALVGGTGVGVTLNFDITAPLRLGSKVDFVVTPGSSNRLDYDYVDFRGQISVPAPAPTTFAAWREQNFTAAELLNTSISGDAAAPAGDGVKNLVKYSANVNAKKMAFTALPVGGVQKIANQSYLTLSYRKSTSPTDLVFTTELNTGNLASGVWNAGGVLLGVPVTNGDGTQTITVRDEVPLGPGATHRFMRLRISRP